MRRSILASSLLALGLAAGGCIEYGAGEPCADADNDGHAARACGGDDCDDGRSTTHPGMPEICDDGLDNNCDGTVDGLVEACDDGDPSTVGEVCRQGACLVPPDIYAECEDRGGLCTWVDDLDADCPAGTYSPFSGHLRMCPTGSIQLCCVPTGGFGSPCTLAEPCDNGGCLPEQSAYPPEGLCGQVCEPDLAPTGCPAWATCIPVPYSQAMGMCMISCAQDEMCRPGWSCQAFPRRPWEPELGTTYVCWDDSGQMGGLGLGQACSLDADCLSGLCAPGSAGQPVCAASCDQDHPCLPGFSCQVTAAGAFCLPD